MGGLFGGGKKPEAPKPLPLPESPDPIESAGKAAENVRKRAANLTKTVYGSPLGLSGQASTVRKTLTGQ